MTNQESTSPAPFPSYADAKQKIFVSRIPTIFDVASVRRLLEEQLGVNTVLHVALAYEKDDQEDAKRSNREEDERFYRPNKKAKTVDDEHKEKEHLGFGFATLENTDLVQKAINEIKTVRGGAKPTSTRKHTLYIGPCLNDSEDSQNGRKQSCFLYAKGTCPYGNKCKFSHEGPAPPVEHQQQRQQAKKPKKCRDHRKGKCKLGDICPFSHDFEPKRKPLFIASRPDSEKDCIDWKTKGKCRKLEKHIACPYRHDPIVQQVVLAKKAKKKQQQRSNSKTERQNPQQQDTAETNQSVRVFGLNYDTREDVVRALFANHCGGASCIARVDFPVFADSGRSKGYCGITFQSSAAASKAIELTGTELDGRWLSIQAGPMLLDEWEQQYRPKRQKRTD